MENSGTVDMAARSTEPTTDVPVRQNTFSFEPTLFPGIPRVFTRASARDCGCQMGWDMESDDQAPGCLALLI